MARKRDPRRDEAFEIWKKHKGEITNRSLAEQLDVSEKTLSGWKSKDKWNGVLQSNEKSTPNKATKKKQAKRSGNPNPKNQFSHRNNPKLLHGLRSKFLHEEQIEIIEAMEGYSIADQLWFQIEIKFSAIIRMQKIMWVEDSHATLNEESMVSSSMEGSSTGYKIAYAYEQYEAYIKAQARAMAEYRNLAKQFLSLSHEEDERRLKLNQMQLNIEKTKAETAKVKAETKNEKDGKKNQTVIITGEDEMRKVLAQKARDNHDDE